MGLRGSLPIRGTIVKALTFRVLCADRDVRVVPRRQRLREAAGGAAGVLAGGTGADLAAQPL